MLDLAVVNGLVFVEGGFRKADVGIQDGKFALVGAPGSLPEAKRTIDAAGKYVLPGGIDTHVHYRDPGHAERETFQVGTRAAAAGGCTTFFEHPISIPPQYNAEILHNRLDLCKKGSCVDYCFYGAAGGEFPEEIVPLSKEGVVAYKTFLHQAPEGRDAEFKGLTSANNAELMRALEEVKKTGLPLAAHAEDNELVTGNIKRLRAEGRTYPLAHCESRPPIVEVEAIAKMLRFGKETGCPVELVHVSTCGAMELAKKAKQEGQTVYVETCPHYLLLDESYVEKYGAYAKCNPALRKKEEIDKLWDYVNDGTVDFIGSDHSPYLVSEKEKSPDDIFVAPSGFPGIDLRLPLMLTEAKKGRVSMERVVELLCVNPAKCFNIFPQKGTISAGADGDLVIVDMNKEYEFDAKNSYSQARDIMKVFQGWKLGCSVDYTVVRGRVVVENGVVDESAAGWGEFVRPNSAK
ncbi:allantoinase AllB [Pseudoflavonifractor phocaeensis]|uniref:allantoinase AllB n=1 Tax=Pseudoflavonifractor phocaeensis TaxID=1870988 RepID=UPI0025A3AC5E|nr:allantoinase AllB [Pseudoflavonifractor phocaeensis]MDM8238741.1 allantoinase AllB [Pseudoflavonifractor phocaeensis]